MRHYDVFNGDADGICALQQLRLAQPREAVLVTGLKRDIALLARVDAQAGDSVTVLDVSLHRNREALQALLARGVHVDYFDHHFAGEVPVHPLLHATLDPAPGVCTSLLVDRHLDGRQRRWAVVGAFGDNMPAPAQALAAAGGLAPDEIERLRALGEAINYNAYGETEADVLVPAARLVPLVRPFADPLDFLAQDPLAQTLVQRAIEAFPQALETLGRIRQHLAGHQVDIEQQHLTLGRWIEVDRAQENITAIEGADAATLERARYWLRETPRPPYVIPEIV